MNFKEKFRLDAKIKLEDNRPDIDFSDKISFLNPQTIIKPSYYKRKVFYGKIAGGTILAAASISLAIILTSPKITGLDSISTSPASEAMNAPWNSIMALNIVEYPETSNSQKAISNDYQGEIGDFAYNSAKYILNNDLENHVYSPVSFYMALGMLLEGSSGEAYNEIAALLGADSLSKLQTDMQNLYDNIYNESRNNANEITQKSYLANAAFINDNIPVKQTYVDVLTKYFYSSIFHTDFGNVAKSEIAQWANINTNELSSLSAADVIASENTSMMLINTIYFQSLWENAFVVTNESVTESFLNTHDNTTTQAVYMNKKLTRKYLAGANYEAASVSLTEGYKMLFVLPNDGVECSTILDDSVAMNAILNYTTTATENRDITFKIPRFTAYSRHEMKDYLIASGVDSIFNDASSMSNAFTISKTVSSITQEAVIDVKENGVIVGDNVTPSYDSEYYPPASQVELNFDHSFIYVLMNADDTPLFIGTTNSIA